MYNPYGISHRCILRQATLPAVPCDHSECEWFINDLGLNNCFWVLAHVIGKYDISLSPEEIARLEGISEEEVNEIINTASKKYSLATRHWTDL